MAKLTLNVHIFHAKMFHNMTLHLKITSAKYLSFHKVLKALATLIHARSASAWRKRLVAVLFSIWLKFAYFLSIQYFWLFLGDCLMQFRRFKGYLYDRKVRRSLEALLHDFHYDFGRCFESARQLLFLFPWIWARFFSDTVDLSV